VTLELITAIAFSEAKVLLDEVIDRISLKNLGVNSA